MGSEMCIRDSYRRADSSVSAELEHLEDLALMALQGPGAARSLSRLPSSISSMRCSRPSRGSRGSGSFPGRSSCPGPCREARPRVNPSWSGAARVVLRWASAEQPARQAVRLPSGPPKRSLF